MFYPCQVLCGPDFPAHFYAAWEKLQNLFEMFEIVDVLAYDARCALDSAMGDYEDAMLASVALRNDCSHIVTRNVKDFEDSPVDAISPEDFVDAFKPSNYEYSIEEF